MKKYEARYTDSNGLNLTGFDGPPKYANTDSLKADIERIDWQAIMPDLVGEGTDMQLNEVVLLSDGNTVVTAFTESGFALRMMGLVLARYEVEAGEESGDLHVAEWIFSLIDEPKEEFGKRVLGYAREALRARKEALREEQETTPVWLRPEDVIDAASSLKEHVPSASAKPTEVYKGRVLSFVTDDQMHPPTNADTIKANVLTWPKWADWTFMSAEDFDEHEESTWWVQHGVDGHGEIGGRISVPIFSYDVMSDRIEVPLWFDKLLSADERDALYGAMDARVANLLTARNYVGDHQTKFWREGKDLQKGFYGPNRMPLLPDGALAVPGQLVECEVVTDLLDGPDYERYLIGQEARETDVAEIRRRRPDAFLPKGTIVAAEVGHNGALMVRNEHHGWPDVLFSSMMAGQHLKLIKVVGEYKAPAATGPWPFGG